MIKQYQKKQMRLAQLSVRAPESLSHHVYRLMLSTYMHALARSFDYQTVMRVRLLDGERPR